MLFIQTFPYNVLVTVRVSVAFSGEAVSYTHLDVYKRQGKAYDNGAHAAYNLGSQYGGNSGLLRDCLHAGNVGKAYAQDNRKAGTQMETCLLYTSRCV